jgi:hypothetical protein
VTARKSVVAAGLTHYHFAAKSSSAPRSRTLRQGHTTANAITLKMADSEQPVQPAAEGADNLHKDPVTGEMISKSECTRTTLMFRSKQTLMINSEASPEAARQGRQEGREGSNLTCSTEEGEEG